MDRRTFLKWLGIAPAVAAAAPLLKTTEPSAKNVEATLKKQSDSDYYHKLRDERGGPGSWVSYRFHYTVSLPPNSHKRIRFIDSTGAVS